MKLPAHLDRTRIGAICVLICVAYAIAGFYPFDFITGNDVRWLTPGPGISLSGHALVRSSVPIDLSSAPGITLEFYLEPAEEPSRELGTLMSLYDGRLPENLVVAQWRNSILVRAAARDSRGRRRYREAGATAVSEGTRRFIAVTSGSRGIRFYSDGALVRSFPKMSLNPEARTGELILGTGVRSVNAWKGKLFGVALFCAPLTPAEIGAHRKLWVQARGPELAGHPSIAGLYLFTEGSGQTVRDASSAGHGLLIPVVYRPPAKEILRAPWDNWESVFSQRRDLALNVLGFIPFGFFYYIYRILARPGRRVSSALQAVVAAFAISLIIELLQTFLPSRSSSLVDLMCNTVGGLAGVIAALLMVSQSCGYTLTDRT